MIINCWGIRNNTLTITKSFRVWRSSDSAEPLALRGSLKYLAAQVQPFLAGWTVVNPQMFVDQRWKNSTIFLSVVIWTDSSETAENHVWQSSVSFQPPMLGNCFFKMFCDSFIKLSSRQPLLRMVLRSFFKDINFNRLGKFCRSVFVLFVGTRFQRHLYLSFRVWVWLCGMIVDLKSWAVKWCFQLSTVFFFSRL